VNELELICQVDFFRVQHLKRIS